MVIAGTRWRGRDLFGQPVMLLPPFYGCRIRIWLMTFAAGGRVDRHVSRTPHAVTYAGNFSLEMSPMKQRTLRRLRSICLSLPEAEEQETWGEATFRVRNRIFCMHIGEQKPPALWCKAPAGSQTILVGADPKRFFVPP